MVTPICCQKGKIARFLALLDVSKETSQRQKDAHLKMEHNGTFSIEIGCTVGPRIDFPGETPFRRRTYGSPPTGRAGADGAGRLDS